MDHVATLRQARYRNESNTFGGFVEPDPASMAWLAEEAGADGITMHVLKIGGMFRLRMCKGIWSTRKPV